MKTLKSELLTAQADAQRKANIIADMRVRIEVVNGHFFRYRAWVASETHTRYAEEEQQRLRAEFLDGLNGWVRHR